MPTCRCGSGLPSHELLDAAGIYCARVCEKCEAQEKVKFKPSIFKSGSPYSATGDEVDIDVDWGDA